MDDGDTLPRRDQAKAEAARAFDSAIREAGVSNAAIGDDLGVKGTRVANLRSDDPADLGVVPNTADLLLVREEVFAAWLARLQAARKLLHGPSAAKTPEKLLARALIDDANVQLIAAGVLEDGVCEPVEVPEVLAALDRSDVTRTELRTALQKRGQR